MGEILAHCRDEGLAVSRELGLAHTRKRGKLIQSERPAFDHLAQRGVVEYDVGRHSMLVRQALAQGTQAVEQGIALRRAAGRLA